MRPSSTARRYAEAAFDVAGKDGDREAWLRDLRAATHVLEDPSMGRYFLDPKVGREEKLNALESLAKTLSPHILNLIRILAVRHRLHLLPSITDEFEALQRESRGIVEAHVTVAREIGDEERQEIATRLQTLTGKQVEVDTEIDPRILGGIVVRIGDRLIDASVHGRLQRLRQELAV